MPNYWLAKTEPGDYSIDDLASDGRTAWTGVRNYQARNYMRDQMRAGDPVLFYHSNGKPPSVVGLAVVAGPSYPDPTAFDPSDSHFDPSSRPEVPTWMLVDLEFKEKFPRPLGLDAIKADPALSGCMVAARGSRLSIQPVSPEHFRKMLSLAGSSLGPERQIDK